MLNKVVPDSPVTHAVLGVLDRFVKKELGPLAPDLGARKKTLIR
nr:hypothetical protein [uncultured Pseudogulbenkiania sp.]